MLGHSKPGGLDSEPVEQSDHARQPDFAGEQPARDVARRIFSAVRAEPAGDRVDVDPEGAKDFFLTVDPGARRAPGRRGRAAAGADQGSRPIGRTGRGPAADRLVAGSLAGPLRRSGRTAPRIITHRIASTELSNPAAPPRAQAPDEDVCPPGRIGRLAGSKRQDSCASLILAPSADIKPDHGRPPGRWCLRLKIANLDGVLEIRSALLHAHRQAWAVSISQ